MAMVHTRIRLAIAAIAFLILAAAAAPVAAQQPGSVDPNADAVKEQQLLQDHYFIQGLGTIPDTKSYVIEQPLGRVWRAFHEVWLRWIGAIVILGVAAFLAAVYFTRGPIRIEAGRSGRTIPRFKSFERVTHWMIATSFAILALTGLNITFGRALLLPLVGPAAFSHWSLMAKYAHNFSSFPFTVGFVILFLLWAKANIPTAVDIRWFKAGGGMIEHVHPPADKFNGGQKLYFWIAVLGTVGVAASGLFLLFPFYFTNIIGMQIAQVAHALIAMAFVALIIAHIYIGAIGMEGGWEAMATGEVDLNWAKQHHSLWVEQELGQGRNAAPPAGARTTPAA
jgi:formate dehydrogenase subunit gamma